MKANLYIQSSIHWPSIEDGVIGIVVAPEGIEPKSVFGFANKVSSNEALLLGLKNGLRFLKYYNHIDIWIDKGYIASTLSNDWIRSWKKNSFVDQSGKERMYAAIWDEIFNLTDGKELVIHPGEHHEFSNFLSCECSRRAKKHERFR